MKKKKKIRNKKEKLQLLCIVIYENFQKHTTNENIKCVHTSNICTNNTLQTQVICSNDLG